MDLTVREQEINHEIIKFLIENGANREIQTLKGKCAFDLCSKH